MISEDNRVWICGDNGIGFFDRENQHWNQIFQSNQSFYFPFVDRAGNLVCAANADGITKLGEFTDDNIMEISSVKTDEAFAIPDANNGYWIIENPDDSFHLSHKTVSHSKEIETNKVLSGRI
jgi:hypothetical protein